MAEIVLGLGTSHGSQVSLTPEWWQEHGKLDRERTDYDELLATADPERIEPELTMETMQRKYEAAQRAVGEVSASLLKSNPDVVVIVGDDQGEMFPRANMPALAIYRGVGVDDIPRDLTNVPESRKAAMWAKHAEQRETYPVADDLGTGLVEQMMVAGFDVTQMSEQPEGRSLGHAFTFVRLRLMGEDIIPILPIMLNTYYPPNQPRAVRCYEFGKALGRAIREWEDSRRVAIVASGGLSHFAVDEALDRGVLEALAARDADALRSLPERKLQSGSSEIKNWIVTAAAVGDLDFELIDYLPGYRSPAGTGCGLGFVRWV